MNNLLYKNSSISQITCRRFNDNLMLFQSGERTPFATRATLDSDTTLPCVSDAHIIYQSEFISISRSGRYLFCSLNQSDMPYAVISLFNEKYAVNTIREIEDYVSMAAAVDPLNIYKINYRYELHKMINSVASYCGCLTDINKPDEEQIFRSAIQSKAGSPYPALALPAVCLLFRRLAALRGFNFKPIFHDGIPYFAFSARILKHNITSVDDISEYRALKVFEKAGEITLYSRLSDDRTEDSEELAKLTLIMTSQVSDPSGIMRAPEWKKHTLDILDSAEIDIPGRF